MVGYDTKQFSQSTPTSLDIKNYEHGEKSISQSYSDIFKVLLSGAQAGEK